MTPAFVWAAQEAAKGTSSVTGSIVFDATIVTLILNGIFLGLREWLKVKQANSAAAAAQSVADKAEAEADRAEAQALGRSGGASDRSRDTPCMNSPLMVGLVTTVPVMKQGQDEMRVVLTELAKTQTGQNEMLKQLVRSTNLLVRCAAIKEAKAAAGLEEDPA